MSTLTPGPWEFVSRLNGSENHAGYFVRASKPKGNGKFSLALVQPLDQDGDLGEANARLIAAAPCLLAALQAVLHDCENLDMVESNEPGRDAGPWLMATNAIARATGGGV